MSTFAPQLQSIIGKVKPQADSTQADPLAKAASSADAVDVVSSTPAELPKTVDAHVAAPAKLAIVYAIPDGSSFRLQKYYGTAAGFRDREKTPDSDMGSQSKLRILGGQVRAADSTPQDVCSSAFNLNTEEPLRRLVDWLREIRTEEPDLHVLFVERTDLGIPWEMIYDDQDGVYLGEKVRLTRLPASRSSLLPGKAPPATCKGQIAFFDIPDLPEPTSQEDRDSLAAHLQRMRTASKVPAFGELGHNLKTPRADVGLIYLLCHGFVDEVDVNASWLGRKDKEQGRVFYRDLLPPRDNLLRKSKSLVLINACEAGRVHGKDPGLSESTPLGFPERFLGLGAPGVIGALAEVELTYAVRFAEALLSKAKENPDTPIPELIRMIRQDAANRMREQDDTSAWYYAFLYVYYGNPYTTLQLEAGGQPR